MVQNIVRWSVIVGMLVAGSNLGCSAETAEPETSSAAHEADGFVARTTDGPSGMTTEVRRADGELAAEVTYDRITREGGVSFPAARASFRVSFDREPGATELTRAAIGIARLEPQAVPSRAGGQTTPQLRACIELDCIWDGGYDCSWRFC